MAEMKKIINYFNLTKYLNLKNNMSLCKKI